MTRPPTVTTHPTRQRPLLDVPGVAEYLTISIRHVRRLVAERRMPHHKVGHLIRFDPDEIDAWLTHNHRGPDDHRRGA